MFPWLSERVLERRPIVWRTGSGAKRLFLHGPVRLIITRDVARKDKLLRAVEWSSCGQLCELPLKITAPHRGVGNIGTTDC